MAKTMDFCDELNFTDLYDDTSDQFLSLIKDYRDQPVVSLKEAIKPVSGFFRKIDDNVSLALNHCRNPLDGLTQDEAASIHLYSMGLCDGPSFYLSLNKLLGDENRNELKPWFPFLKLLLTALHKLSLHSGAVWRDAQSVDLSSKYKTGAKFTDRGVSASTTYLEVLESDQFWCRHGLVVHKQRLLSPLISKMMNPIKSTKELLQKRIISIISVTPNMENNPRIASKEMNAVEDHRKGGGTNRCHRLFDLFVDDDHQKSTIDRCNRRILQWKMSGTNGHEQGNRLNPSVDVLIDKETRSRIICDRNNRRWPSLNDITPDNALLDNIVCRGLAMDEQRCLYITDTHHHYTMMVSERCKKRYCHRRVSTQSFDDVDGLSNSRQLVVDTLGTLYAVYNETYPVITWSHAATYGTVIVRGNGKGNRTNQSNDNLYSRCFETSSSTCFYSIDTTIVFMFFFLLNKYRENKKK
ncbi:unnamed protein product [Rotaria magnacalcarata]|uniref:Uncharacterized protein n=1 Tax=Rotaria magnacalcarata TaxID=392030 RepID=A0A816ML70_9BILA|nr:unnamed protein product [Rotaria magnacalcarata]